MTTSVTGTSGYYGSSDTRIIVERNICTNPWDLAPRVRIGVRPVVGYCESLLRRIRQNIDTIVNQLPKTYIMPPSFPCHAMWIYKGALNFVPEGYA